MKLFSFCAYWAFIHSQHDWNNSEQMLQFDEQTRGSVERVRAPCLCNQQWTRARLLVWCSLWLASRKKKKKPHLKQMDASERQQSKENSAVYILFIWSFIFALNEDGGTRLSKCHVAFKHHNACGENVTLTAKIFYEWQYNKTASILWWCGNRKPWEKQVQSVCLLRVRCCAVSLQYDLGFM